MIKIVIRNVIALSASFFGLVACEDGYRHQFELDYEKSARMTVICHNCFYYTDDYDTPPDTKVIDREIDGKAIDLFTSIEFCGLGFTTPDVSLIIETDTGSKIGIGILFPDQEFSPKLRMQSGETGLGEGCSRLDQQRFERFFHSYAAKYN